MTRYAFAERLALADLMEQVGPDAPTLCGEWTVRDLLAHLLLRERRPDAAVGILIKRFAARTEHVQRGFAAEDFATQLAALRKPPWWSPVSNVLLDEVVNLVEIFVHHEDVRRARPGWEPRELPQGMEAALFSRVRVQARLALRRFPATVHLEAPGLGAARGGRADPDVLILSGQPSELTLFLYGRQAHARAEVFGRPELAERLRHARLGI